MKEDRRGHWDLGFKVSSFMGIEAQDFRSISDVTGLGNPASPQFLNSGLCRSPEPSSKHKRGKTGGMLAAE